MLEVSLLEHTTIIEVQQDVVATELCLTGAVQTLGGGGGGGNNVWPQYRANSSINVRMDEGEEGERKFV